MGYTESCKRDHIGDSKAPDKVFTELAYHPSFKFPRVPKELTPEAVSKFVAESIARFVSPSPKFKGEDEEFRCDDLAKTIRKELLPEIQLQLKLER